MRTLLAGRSQVLITRQEGAIVPVPFEELMNPETGRTRVRMVDTSTESFATANAHQVRLEAADLEDAAFLAAIAELGNLTPEQVRERFVPIS